MFDSILVANRGEIALRIMRTAQAMGIQTIAIYVDADKDSPHVRFADKAVLLPDGGYPVSYTHLTLPTSDLV